MTTPIQKTDDGTKKNSSRKEDMKEQKVKKKIAKILGVQVKMVRAATKMNRQSKKQRKLLGNVMNLLSECVKDRVE